jgi:hypothetical protein
MAHKHKLREVHVARTREAIIEAENLLRLGVFTKSLRDRVDKWIRSTPFIMEGLPQTYQVSDLVSYIDPDHGLTDGVVVCTVTCHENYVVARGDNREAKTDVDGKERKLWILGVEKIAQRGGKPEITEAC